MRWLGEQWRKLRMLVLRKQFDADLEDEMRLHVELRAEQQIGTGMGSSDARNAARRRFGNATLLKELSRETWGWRWLETLAQDVRYGLRMLRRSPGFTAVATGSLALGIGANTAIFTLMDALFFKMLPVEKPEQLVWLRGALSFPGYQKISESNRVFSSMIAVDAESLSASGLNVSGEGERITGQMVSGNYYPALGVKALIGRVLTPEDDRIPGIGGHDGPVAVLSYAYWNRRFARDRSVVGKNVVLNGVPITIVGVTPPEFSGVYVGSCPDLTVPVMLQPRVWPSSWTALWQNGRQGSYLDYDADDGYGPPILARLKLGVTREQAEAELNVFYQQHLAARTGGSPDERQKRALREGRIRLVPAGNELSRSESSRIPLLVFSFMAIPGLVLLIACANVANLLLARASARQREIAVRMSIGAGRFRLIRQFLTECLLLSLIGGAAGVALAIWGLRLLVALMSASAQSPFYLQPAVNSRMLVFAVAVSLAAAALFGLAPAFRATKANLSTMLKTAKSQAGGRWWRWEPRKVLVVSQVALSLLLLISAGLFVRSLQNLKGLDLGYSRQNLMLVSTSFFGYFGPRSGVLMKQIWERLDRLPGVRAVGMADDAPVHGAWRRISVEGYTPKSVADTGVERVLMGPGFLEAVGIPLLAGRTVTIKDDETAPKVCVVSAAMAQTFFPGTNPIGQHFVIRRPGLDTSMEVIGIAKDVRKPETRDQPWHPVYCASLQDLPTGKATLAIRTVGDPAPVVAEVRRRIREIDPSLILEVKSMDTALEGYVFFERWLARLSGGFGVLALLLACVGLYGVMAYAVTERNHEIGIRMALGAMRVDVVGMILKDTLRLVLVGIGIGVPAALAATRLISSMLFGLKPTDPPTILIATSIMALVGVLAGYIPARRASFVDPMVTLRHE